MTIAITGASGQLGRLAIAKLKTLTDPTNILALARNSDSISDLGVATRAADYTKPETLAAALQGVDVLALISSSDFNDRARQHRNVIAAAKAAGVKRIIYTSILKADSTPMLIAADHKATEAVILESGLPYTFLRNGWYVENWTGSLAGAIAAGAMIGSAGEGKVAPATRAEFADALAVVAAGQGHDNKVYELAGTIFTLPEMAAEVSAQTGKTIPYNTLSAADYAAILESFGLPAGFAHVLADSDVGASNGWLFDDSKTLERLIGRPTTSLAAAVKAALA